MRKSKYSYFSIFTILLFVLGIFNIIFAWLGFICIITPFILLVTKKQNKWCQNFCPRKNLYQVLFKKTKSRKTPNWLKSDGAKEFFLYYFILNFVILLWSTILVSINYVRAIEAVRFMIAFQLPWDIPQYIHVSFLPPWVTHLSFRIYSMILTTTVFGLIIEFLYKPRSWCSVCPIMTLSNKYLTNVKIKNKK